MSQSFPYKTAVVVCHALLDYSPKRPHAACRPNSARRHAARILLLPPDTRKGLPSTRVTWTLAAVGRLAFCEDDAPIWLAPTQARTVGCWHQSAGSAYFHDGIFVSAERPSGSRVPLYSTYLHTRRLAFALQAQTRSNRRTPIDATYRDNQLNYTRGNRDALVQPPCGAATNTGCAIFVTGTVSCCVRTGGRGEEALAPAGTPVGFAVTCTGAACASRSRADAMRDASAEAVRLRSRVRELEARLRHAMSGACAERVRLRARVRELEARLRRYKPTHCIAPVRPNNGVPARGRC